MVTEGESIRVLVVEDEESYRQALTSGLGREGFEVDVAADGTEALRSFAERPPDIVLLDILLPGMRGIEVCRRMRELSAVPIVMVSAVDAELDVVLGFELGAAGYVTKPFRLRELVARMHAILRRVSRPTTAGGRRRRPSTGPAARGFPEDGIHAPTHLRLGDRRLRPAGGHRGRGPDPPVPARVRPAGRAAVPAPMGAHPGRADRPAVAGPVPLGQPHPGHPHPPAPGQARAGPRRAPLHRDRAGGGLPHRPRRRP